VVEMSGVTFLGSAPAPRFRTPAPTPKNF